jgi:hypothetical protein
MTKLRIGQLLFALLVGGCDALDLPAAKDFRGSDWYESGPDTLFDGAMRVSTWTHADERYLTIRCFKSSGADALGEYDLRYKIDVPLLERVVDELQKSTALTIAVAVDGRTIGFYKARAGFQHEQLWFLAEVEEGVIAELAAAEREINVVPREEDNKLDKIIAFSSAGLAERIKPVIEACANETKVAPATAPAAGVASQ